MPFITMIVIAVLIIGTIIIMVFPVLHVNAIVNSLGYETGNISSGWEWGNSQGCHLPPRGQTRCPTDPFVPVNSPVRDGSFALKATIKGDERAIDNRERAEVLTSPRFADFPQDSVVHYHWYTMFPDQTVFPAQNRWEVWTQWHQSNDAACCRPDLEFVYNNERIGLWVYRDPYNSDILWEEPIKRLHWYDINLFVKWSTNSNGFVELWVDGENKVKKRSHITLDPNFAPYSAYLKQGLYRDTGIQDEQSIYHDGMEFSYLPTTTVWSDILSRITITSLGRINGQDRVLTPIFHTTQRGLEGKSDWAVFDYVWKENPKQHDIEAIVGIVPSSNEYVIEVGKLTRLAIKIDIDGGSRSITIPATPIWGQASSGFAVFAISG